MYTEIEKLYPDLICVTFSGSNVFRFKVVTRVQPYVKKVDYYDGKLYLYSGANPFTPDLEKKVRTIVSTIAREIR